MLSGVLSLMANPRFVLYTFLGSVAGLFVGAIPGLSVSMATALLVSITCTWPTGDAMAMIMGVYVVGVFSGAVSAILINIPGAPSSVVTTLDGYPMARRGEAHRALTFAAVYSFVGSVFGLLVLSLLAGPVSAAAVRFQPMEYFLLSLFGLMTVGGLSGKSFARGLFSALLGIFFSLVGLDPILGTPRLTFGIQPLKAGIPTVPALVGLFGFAEVLHLSYSGAKDGEVPEIRQEKFPLREILGEFPRSLWYSAVGAFVGALPGAGGPVASFLAYAQARRLVRHPSRPFGEGAYEGIAASESANNACIGGALIPMLTLAIPGDAVTAILLSVFTVHGLRPGPAFLRTDAAHFYEVLAGGFLGCGFLLLLGLLCAPRLSRVVRIKKRVLLPLVAVLSVIGAYACNGRLFDVGLMIFFGALGFLLRRLDFPVAPVTLGLVLGSMMDGNFRRAMSLASTAENPLSSLFGRPAALLLLLAILVSLFLNLPIKKRFKRP